MCSTLLQPVKETNGFADGAQGLGNGSHNATKMFLQSCWKVQHDDFTLTLTKKTLGNCHHLPHTFLTDPKEQAGSTGQDVKGISNT